jgi:hypothetical protein
VSCVDRDWETVEQILGGGGAGLRRGAGGCMLMVKLAVLAVAYAGAC